MEDVALHVPLVYQIRNDTDALVNVLAASTKSHCPLNYLHLDPRAHDLEESLDDGPPEDDSDPIHEQIYASFQPKFLILLAEFIVAVEICSFDGIDNTTILSKILLFFRISLIQFPNKYPTRNQISHDQIFLSPSF